ncbi:hypothetical protein [Dyella sp.]|uniref:hypothetical protein n=1 Tax=Dyella sp. TaxID=1869338 RepID=UPI002FD957F0
MIESVESLVGYSVNELRERLFAAGLKMVAVTVDDEFIESEEEKEARIASGDLTQFISMHADGISFSLTKDRRVDAIYLYAHGHEGFSDFRGFLPCGLSFDMSRNDVRSHFEDKYGIGPSRFNDGQEISGLGFVPAWDLYVVNDYAFHIQYNDHWNAINLVTLGKSQGWPGLD